MTGERQKKENEMSDQEMAPYIKRIKQWSHFQATHQEWKSEKIEDILGELVAAAKAEEAGK